MVFRLMFLSLPAPPIRPMLATMLKSRRGTTMADMTLDQMAPKAPT